MRLAAGVPVRGGAVLLLSLLLSLTGVPVEAQEGSPSPEPVAPDYETLSDDYLTLLDGSAETFAMLGDDFSPSNGKQARQQAKPIAEYLSGVLLSVQPADCYRDYYLALWVLYGTLRHVAEGTARNSASIFITPDTEAATLAMDSMTCDEEIQRAWEEEFGVQSPEE